MKAELQSKIEDFLQNLETEIDVLSMVDIEEIDFQNAFWSIFDMIEDSNGFDIEIIYYSNAIDYLQRNDPSLQESLAIAHEMGFTLENINSELLASLLASESVRDEFYNLADEINSFFEDLEEN